MTMNVRELMVFQKGLEFDLEEGWGKIISRQFGGPPGREYGELIQNALDGYSSNTPWKERRLEIMTEPRAIVTVDYGQGLSRQRLWNLVTLGATDKRGDETKIGEFGLGFCTMFNPRLGAKKVIFSTLCEGRHVKLVFRVVKPGKRPEISAGLIDEPLDCSTRVRVEFDHEKTSGLCLDHARKRLQYLPCPVRINNETPATVWTRAEQKKAVFFREGPTEGFIDPTGGWIFSKVTVLCKYEYILRMSLGRFAVHRDNRGNLSDYFRGRLPFLPGAEIVVNCNQLSLVISRDGYFLNDASDRMESVIRRAMMKNLLKLLEDSPDRQEVLANQYIFRKRLKKVVQTLPERAAPKDDGDKVLELLARAGVYPLTDEERPVSLRDIRRRIPDGTPMFYSSRKKNLAWLGGRFKHDFIVLPDPVQAGGGAPDFYGELFKEIFKEAIDLDFIESNPDLIKNLVDRGIADPMALKAPETRLVNKRGLSSKERQTLRQIDAILSHKSVEQSIRNHLHLPVRSVFAAFFDLEEDNGTIAAGIFDETGAALEASCFSNLDLESQPPASLKGNSEPKDIFLGLRRHHPFIQKMVESRLPDKAYYALTFLAHELVACQKLLRPGAEFSHKIQGCLARDMRRALMEHLLSAPRD